MSARELPLRIIEQTGGYTIRCLCGAESALIKPAALPSMAIVRANRGTGVLNRGASPDASPAAVLRMALHAKSCRTAQSRAMEAGHG